MTLYKLTEAWDMIKETHVENGWVRGVAGADPHVISFKGIPFAAPPVGKLRWHAPMPAEDWEGVLDCCRFGAISPQRAPWLVDNIYKKEWNVDPKTACTSTSGHRPIPRKNGFPFMSGISAAE